MGLRETENADSDPYGSSQSDTVGLCKLSTPVLP
jgi:hypothetical protein